MRIEVPLGAIEVNSRESLEVIRRIYREKGIDYTAYSDPIENIHWIYRRRENGPKRD
jgi:hypothetical protein